MKNVIVTAATFCLAAFSASVFAEKLTVSGEPVVIEKQGETYVVPETYKPSSEFQYVVLDGTKRACFGAKRDDFGNLEVITIDARLGDYKVTWHCYPLDSNFFDVK